MSWWQIKDGNGQVVGRVFGQNQLVIQLNLPANVAAAPTDAPLSQSDTAQKSNSSSALASLKMSLGVTSPLK